MTKQDSQNKVTTCSRVEVVIWSMGLGLMMNLDTCGCSNPLTDMNHVADS